LPTGPEGDREKGLTSSGTHIFATSEREKIGKRILGKIEKKGEGKSVPPWSAKTPGYHNWQEGRTLFQEVIDFI